MSQFEIWQLPGGHPNKYMHLDWCKKPVDIMDYVQVYAGKIDKEIKDVDIFLEELFERFNINQPDDYYAASMSVSDLICLIGNCNKRFWFYVDGKGFKEVEVNV